MSIVRAVRTTLLAILLGLLLSAPLVADDNDTSTASIETQKGYPRLGFIVGPTYSLPGGDWLDKTTGGVGVGADLLVSLNRNLKLDFGVARTGIKWDQDELRLNGLLPDLKTEVEIWQFRTMARFELPVDESLGDWLRYQISVGLSLAYRRSGEALYGTSLISPGDGNTQLMIAFGTGVTVMTSDVVGLELDCGIHSGLLSKFIPGSSKDNTPGTDPDEYGSIVSLGLRVVVFPM